MGSSLSIVSAAFRISNSILKLVTAWSVNNSDHFAKKARTVYTELSCMDKHGLLTGQRE